MTPLRARLERLFPALTPFGPIQPLARGWQSAVYESQSGWIIRVGLDAHAQTGYARQWQALKHLSSHLTLPIPIPAAFKHTAPGFEHGVIIHPKLPGTPVPWGMGPKPWFEDALKGFLRQLRAIDTAQALQYGLQPHTITASRLSKLRQNLHTTLRHHLSNVQWASIERWWGSILVDGRLQSFRPTVIHGDLWTGNLLMEASYPRLCGVIDFGEVAVGDPAIDLAIQRYIDGDFAQRLLHDAQNERPWDIHLKHRTDHHWDLRELWGLETALERADMEEALQSIDKLRAWGLISRL